LRNFGLLGYLKKNFLSKVVKSFTKYPHNGCRKKKLTRKKVKKKEMAEWFKAADCKSVEFLIVGSNPAFFK
jgi:NAD+--asparagine ADP-ribosyltransferase